MIPHSEPFDVEANIVKILLRRGVPERYVDCQLSDIHPYVRSHVDSGRWSYFIHGICGVGKTHLAVAVMRDAIIHNSQGAYRIDTCVRGIYDTQFIPVTSLLMRIKATFGPEAQETETEIISRVSDIGLLVLDDLGSEKASEWVLQTLYTIMDIRSREGRPVIITSNLSLDEIAQKLSDRVASRITGMCKVITMAGKDRRLKR